MTGSSGYPNTIDSFSENHQDGIEEKIRAQTINDLADAVHHIELEMGINPKGLYDDVKSRLTKLEYPDFNNQTGLDYILALTDISKYVIRINANPNTVTIPLYATVAFPDNTIIVVRQGGDGATTIQGVSGVTLVNPYESFTLVGHGAEVKLMKIGTNAWGVNGDVVIP